jgi:hypothetical protein
MSCEEPTTKIPFKALSALAGGIAYVLFLRPQILKWGTRLGESLRRLPGDDRIKDANLVVTRAINIDAPVEAVWPWLAQMGRDRTGWYSFDFIDNNGIPSATYIRKDLAEPQVGMELDQGLKILDVQSGRLLLFGADDVPLPLGASMDLTMLYYLERKSDGSSRLLVRMRGHAYGLTGRIVKYAFEIADFVMGIRQAQGIKARAETMAHLNIAVPLEHEISLN